MDFQNLEHGTAEDLGNGTDIDGLHFKSVPPSPLQLRDATVLGCRFTETRSPDVDLCGAAVRETVFERPDFTIVQAWRGRWTDVRVQGGRLSALEAYDSMWNGVEFVGCKLSFVNLRGSEVNDLILRNCQIEELDVSESSLRRASLEGTHVQRLNFHGARMERVDLRNATYDEITGVADMRGTIVSQPQLTELAPLLAQSVGIEVAH